MLQANFVSIADIIRCPACHGRLADGEPVRCASRQCDHHAGFALSKGQPVLINFDDSIFVEELYSAQSGSALLRPTEASSIGKFLRRLTYGSDSKSDAIIGRMTQRLLETATRPRILVIGGGTVGEGMVELYTSEQVSVVGTDAYASDVTTLVCDGHELPFQDESFDGVVIQAVLEHVLTPSRVVDEIHRVLKPKGLVFADTPFMQQVHEGAYDFSRFTRAGHRWLFRRFDEVESGVTSGPGIALLWSIAYFTRALGAGPRLTALITAPFFWVRYLERFMEPRLCSDGASATYFVGQKGSRLLAPNEMPAVYGQGG